MADELLAFRWRSAECGEQAASLPAARSDTRALSLELDKLLNAADPEEKDAAWQAFVLRYSRLLLHTVHSHSRGYDDAMDRYALVLERLRQDDCRRLRLSTNKTMRAIGRRFMVPPTKQNVSANTTSGIKAGGALETGLEWLNGHRLRTRAIC